MRVPLAVPRLATLLALLLQQRAAEAKSQIRRLSLGPTPGDDRRGYGKPWLYLGKFGFDRGLGSYSVRAQLVQMGGDPPGNFSLGIFLDEDWHTVEARTDLCERKILSKRERDCIVGPEGEWGPWCEGTVRQSVRPHVWYFAVSVCNLADVYSRTYRIDFEFEAKQPDASHFSYEQKWFLLGNKLGLLGFTAFMLFYILKVYSVSEAHPLIWTLTVILVLQYAAQALHTGHLLSYGQNGIGLKGLEIISEILFMLSQMGQTSLLILIALGYTLLQSSLGELDLVIPLYMVVGAAHIILVLIVELRDEASSTFHDHEGPVGWLLILLRLLLYAWFLWAVQSTWAEAGMRLRTFLRRFSIAGSLYFLAYPASLIFVDLFAPYLRAPILASGQMVMQMASNVWLSYLFLNRGEYFEVSSMSTSILPGGSPSRRFKDQ